MATPSLLSSGFDCRRHARDARHMARGTPQTTATHMPRTPRLIMLKVMPALMYRTGRIACGPPGLLLRRR